jgi:Tfp pilus assembly protein PilX
MQYHKTPFRLFFSLCLLAVGACASGPPVQEMSDARQAIAAAREAGAATYADEGLRAAEARLAEAETQLNQRMYWEARRLAVDAKDSAVDALLRSRELRGNGATPPPPASP